MKNILVMDRARYDGIKEGAPWTADDLFVGISGRMVQFLDYFVIEESDGGATFIKNRWPLADVKGDIYSPEQYDRWKADLLAKLAGM